MKKLPKIYQNEIDKNIKNNKTVYRFKNMDTRSSTPYENNKTVKETLDEIFNGIGYALNIVVLIKTKSKEYETTLVARTSNNIVTIDNEVIPIEDILNLEIKNK